VQLSVIAMLAAKPIVASLLTKFLAVNVDLAPRAVVDVAVEDKTLTDTAVL